MTGEPEPPRFLVRELRARVLHGDMSLPEAERELKRRAAGQRSAFFDHPPNPAHRRRRRRPDPGRDPDAS